MRPYSWHESAFSVYFHNFSSTKQESLWNIVWNSMIIIMSSNLKDSYLDFCQEYCHEPSYCSMNLNQNTVMIPVRITGSLSALILKPTGCDLFELIEVIICP